MSESESEPEARAIVVVDPDQGVRNEVEDLEDEFGRQVIAMDSMDFDLEASQEVLEAGAFVIAADLGIRAGVDLVEAIRVHASVADQPVLIGLDVPTRDAVRWAISLGADGVCARPYDADELRARLEAAVTARSEAAA